MSCCEDGLAELLAPRSVRHELLRRRRQVLRPLHVRRLLRPLLLRLLAIGQVVVGREVARHETAAGQVEAATSASLHALRNALSFNVTSSTFNVTRKESSITAGEPSLSARA